MCQDGFVMCHYHAQVAPPLVLKELEITTCKYNCTERRSPSVLSFWLVVSVEIYWTKLGLWARTHTPHKIPSLEHKPPGYEHGTLLQHPDLNGPRMCVVEHVLQHQQM